MFFEFIVVGILVVACLAVVAYNCANQEPKRKNSPSITINNNLPVVIPAANVTEEKSILQRCGRIGDKCIICLDPLVQEDFKRMEECQHGLHEHCHRIWTSHSQYCPYCERKFK